MTHRSLVYTNSNFKIWNDIYIFKEFLTSYIHTIGIDFLEKVVIVNDEQIKLQIWDTAGQDRLKLYFNSDLFQNPEHFSLTNLN